MVVKICASTILAPAAAQAPAMPLSSRGWSGATTVSAVTPRIAVGRHLRRQRAHVGRHRVQEVGVRDLPLRLDLEPVGGIVALGIGVELRVRPARQRAAQRLLGRLDPRLAVDRRMAAAEHDLGLPVERAQELALPAVPDARPDGADVGDGQDQQQLELLLRLHDRRQRFGGARVGEVAALRHVGHDRDAARSARRRGRCWRATGRAAGKACARRRRRLSSDPSAGPWRCRAERRRGRARCGARSCG